MMEAGEPRATVVGVPDEDLDPVLASWAFPGLGQRLRNCDLERARIGGSVVWWGGGFFDVFEGERFQFGDQFSEAAGVVQ